MFGDELEGRCFWSENCSVERMVKDDLQEDFGDISGLGNGFIYAFGGVR